MNKHKNRIGTSLLALTLVIAQAVMGAPNVALALGTPFSVIGQVTLDGLPADGAAVTITDANTGAFLTDTVGPTGTSGTSGFYSFDLGNLSIAATNGDTINISATINTLTGTTTFTYDSALGSFIPTTISIVTPPPATFTITATAGANGSITPSGAVTATSGASQTFTITPNATFNVLDVLVDGASVGAVTSYTFANITANHTIDASFTAGPSPTFTITATSSANGTITPSGAVTVTSGASSTFTIAPNAGFVVSDVLVDGGSVGAVTSYTFASVLANHTIAASFIAAPAGPFMITSSAGANGSISPLGMAMVNSGASSTFVITPSAGYQVADVLVDGASVGATTSYTFLNVTADHTIAASFQLASVLTTINVMPTSSSVQVGTPQQFTAAILDQYGKAFAATATWSSSNQAVATVDVNGLATTLATGTTTIAATNGTVVGSATLVVTPVPVLTTLAVSPTSSLLLVGNTQQFTASGFDQLGTPFAATSTWSSSDTAVGTIDAATGLFTAASVGTTTVTATSGTISGTALVTVTVPTLTTLMVSPTSTSVLIGNTEQFTAAGFDQFGAPIAATSTWSSSNTGVGTIDAATGLFTAASVGTTTVTATSGTISGTALVTVNPIPVLTTLVIAPTSTSVIIGNTQQFTAAGFDQLGAPFAATSTWSSSNTGVGTIDAATGLFTAVALGTTTVTATSGSTTASTIITVVPVPVLTGLSISPTSSSVVIGATRQFTATGIDQFGQPMAATSTWSSSNTGVGTIDAATGLFTAVALGTTTVTATSGTTTATASVTVVPVPVLTSISITPINPTVAIGVTQQFTASTLDQNGAPIVATTTWSSSNTTTGTINASGLFTAFSAGTSVITVSSGPLSATTTVTVPVPSVSGGGGGGGNGGILFPPIQTAANVPLVLLPGQVGILEQNIEGGLKVVVNIPAGAVVAKTTFKVTMGEMTSLNETEKSDKLSPVEHSLFNLIATDESGQPVTSFAEPITITMSGVDLPSDIPNLGVYYFNGNIQEWVLIPGALFSTDSRSFSFTTDHMTLFGIFRAPGLPSIIKPSQKIEKEKQAEQQKQVLGVKIYEDGTLIRGSNKKIYVVISGEKELIASIAELRRYAGKPIISVSDSVVTAYPEHKFVQLRNGDLLRGPDKRIYVIKNNKKQPVRNMAELRKYQGKKINNVDAATVAHY